MELANLIHMANRIGQFFEAMPDRAEALDGIADHIRKFWAPVMRAELGRGLQAGEAGELHPLVAEALRRHPQTLSG